jgi:hypothetical protein
MEEKHTKLARKHVPLPHRKTVQNRLKKPIFLKTNSENQRGHKNGAI